MAETGWLRALFRQFDAKPFLTVGSVTATYKELDQAIARWLQKLEGAGVAAGDIVALVADYSVESVGLLLALQEHNCIAVPITTSVEEEIAARLEESQAQHIFTLGQGEPRLASLEHSAPPHDFIQQLRKDQNAGLILFSSGSTGKPKAMIHNLNTLLASYEGRRVRSLALLVFLLFDHIGGLNTLLGALASGQHVVAPLTRKPDEVAELIQQHKVAILPTSPTFLNLLLMSGAAERYDLSSLKIITYGTEPMPESLLSRLREAFPRVKFVQTFGTSETGISGTQSRSSDSLEMKIDQEYKIVDGELWLRSPTRILGYLNAENDRFTPDGWFRTGDLVEESGEGYLRILGRDSEIINVGGEKVMPAEVESCLLELPDVADCSIYGKTNAITGQAVAAKIVAKQGVDPKELKRLIRKHCRKRLTAFKVPAYIEFTDQTDFSDRFKKKR